jgi:1-phosphofructokinase family hexose kinase
MARPGFLAVSPNPAVDRVARIERPGRGAARATEFLETPGGKAIHAACVAAELGADAAVLTTAGGRNGEQLLELLVAEPLDVISVPVAGATRGTYTVVADGGELIEVHEPSPHLSEPEAESLVSALAGRVAGRAVVAVCGSLPRGGPADLHARLIATARAAGAFTILDCSTPEALAAGLEARPDLVAPNRDEAVALAGTGELESVTDAIRERGAAAVWVSLGPEGSVFADAETSARLTAPPPAEVVNTVGCGDALVGGFAAGLVAGRHPLEAAALGVAAPTDKHTRQHPRRVERAAVEALLPRVAMTPLRTEAPVR